MLISRLYLKSLISRNFLISRIFLIHYFFLGYLSPLVAVQINPTENVESQIRCRTYAQNIVYSSKYRLGYVDFSLLLVDEDHDHEKDEF